MFRHGGKFSEAAGTQIKDTGEHGIAHLKAAHAAPDCHHDTGQVTPHRGRQLKLEDGLKRSFWNHVINRIEAGGVNLDENFIRLDRGPRNIGKFDLVGPAVTFQDKCFHYYLLYFSLNTPAVRVLAETLSNSSKAGVTADLSFPSPMVGVRPCGRAAPYIQER